MKKIGLIILGITVVVVAGAYLFRAPLVDLLKDNITANMFVDEDTDGFDPGLPLGSDFPDLYAAYQGQIVTDLAGFMGENGMVVVANRSADWCPYCMRQLVELQENSRSFESAGISIVAITYDAPELQQAFIDSQGIRYPFLSDVDARSMQAMQILNSEYQPGDHHYGIPYPGVYILNPDLQIVGKIFLEPYSIRVDGAGVLKHALTSLTAAPASSPQ